MAICRIDPIPRRFQIVCTGAIPGDYMILASGVKFPDGSCAVGYNEDRPGISFRSMDDLPGNFCGENYTTHLVWLDFETDPVPSTLFVERLTK